MKKITIFSTFSKRIRRFLAGTMAILSLSTGMTALAAEDPAINKQVTENQELGAVSIAPRSIYGYSAYYANSNVGSFYVNAPGSGNSTGATIKTSEFPDGITCYVALYGPGNKLIRSNIKLVGNTEVSFNFWNGSPGTYRIDYIINGVYPGRFHCWIF